MRRLLPCAWSFVLVLQSLAQTREVEGLIERMDLHYQQGDVAGQERIIDSIRERTAIDAEAGTLVTAWRARLLRSEGKARLALDRLDSSVQDTAGLSPVVRFACLDEHTRVLKQLSRFARAAIQSEAEFHLAEDNGLRKQAISALILKAEILRKLGDVQGALSALIDAEKREEAVGYPLARCNIIINRGNIQYQQERFAEALAQFRQARACARENGFPPLEQDAVFNIGSALSQMHNDSIGPAIDVYESALADPHTKGDRLFAADLHGAIALLHWYREDLSKARAELDQALAIRQEIKDTLGQAMDLVTLAKLQRASGHSDEALTTARHALELGRASGALETVRSALWQLARSLRALDRDKEAGEFMEEYIDVDDTLEERESGELTMDLEYKYELGKKEARIADVEARNRRRDLQLAGSAIIAGLLVVLLILVVRNIQNLRARQAQTRQLHEQQVNELLKQQEIRSFDAMMLGQEKERTRVAKDLHDRMGALLSTIRLRFSALQGRIEDLGARIDRQDDQAFKLLDEAVVEVRRISHDMVKGDLSKFGLTVALQDLCDTLRVPGTMDVELGVHGLDQRLDAAMEVAVYRMVQEAVGNVLKHARATELSIQINRAPASLNVLVEDNGVGFDLSNAQEGMGMGNLRERASALGGVVVVDSHVGHGTTVTVDLPLKDRTDA